MPRERETDERRRAMEDACKKMDRLAEKLGSWDSTRVIRQARDSRTRKLSRRR